MKRRKKKGFWTWKRAAAVGALAGAGIVTADLYAHYDGFQWGDVHHETWIIALLLAGAALLV